MTISAEQRMNDTVVDRQRAAWERTAQAFAAKNQAAMAPVEVDSVSRPGVTYRSMKFLQST